MPHAVTRPRAAIPPATIDILLHDQHEAPLHVNAHRFGVAVERGDLLTPGTNSATRWYRLVGHPVGLFNLGSELGKLDIP